MVQDPADRVQMSRLAARVLLIDSMDRTLLFRARDPQWPEYGTWWFTPGGGVEDGETLHQAARRELREETGLDLVELGEPMHTRRFRFRSEGTLCEQVEHFFVARADLTELDTSRWTDVERRAVVEYRWWTLSELCATDEVVYPEELTELLVKALGG